MRACLTSKVFLTASLSKSVLCHLYPHTHRQPSVSGTTKHSLGGKREVLLKIQTFDLQPGRCTFVPRDECQIRDGGLIFDEIPRGAFGKDRLQHTKDALYL